MNRKPIPPPVNLTAKDTGHDLESVFPIPFVIAEGPRMMLNFLAMSSNLPNAYRNMIAQWLLGYNEKLIEYISDTYGGEAAVADADRIAKAMFRGFIEVIREEWDTQEKAMFDNLERDIFGGDDIPE